MDERRADAPVGALQGANMLLAFVVEIAMLVAFGVWAWSLDGPAWARILIAVGCVGLAAGLWGMFAAPKASRRLRGLSLLTFKIVAFGLGALALVAADHVAWGIALAVAGAVTLALATDWREPARP
jgi:hypothetical protein